jgi:hypothetical protein
MRRCQDCNTRFLQCGRSLVAVSRLYNARRWLLLGSAAVCALAAVLLAILYFGHAPASDAAEGMLLFRL